MYTRRAVLCNTTNKLSNTNCNTNCNQAVPQPDQSPRNHRNATIDTRAHTNTVLSPQLWHPPGCSPSCSPCLTPG